MMSNFNDTDDIFSIHALDILNADDDDESFLWGQCFDILNKQNTCPLKPRLIRNPKKFREYSVHDMYEKFRFSHTDVYTMMRELRIPQSFTFDGRHFDGEEAFVIFLRRMACVSTFEKLRDELRREAPRLCVCFNGMVNWMIDTHGCLISGLILYYYYISNCLIIFYLLFHRITSEMVSTITNLVPIYQSTSR